MRENLWMVQCMDREGDDVTALRARLLGHMKHIEDIVDPYCDGRTPQTMKTADRPFSAGTGPMT